MISCAATRRNDVRPTPPASVENVQPLLRPIGGSAPPVAASDQLNAFLQRLSDALRRRVGAGRPMLPKQLAYTLGVTEQLVSQWMAGQKAPSAVRMIELFQLFGADFAHEVLSPHGLGVYSLEDARAADRARRISGFAAAIRAVGALLPAFDGEADG